MKRNDLDGLLEGAEALRERLARDGGRIDALAQAVRDEAWHARASGADPDGEVEREHAHKAAEVERTLDDEFGRLRAHLRNGTERTGT